MPSTASHVGRLLHKHEIENDTLERQLAAEETTLRARLDREHIDAVVRSKTSINGPHDPCGGGDQRHRPRNRSHDGVGAALWVGTDATPQASPNLRKRYMRLARITAENDGKLKTTPEGRFASIHCDVSFSADDKTNVTAH
jgi:hypothetical protein